MGSGTNSHDTEAMAGIARSDFPLICRLADPEGELPDDDVYDHLDPEAVRQTAIDHRVYPVVVRRFSQIKWADQPAFREWMEVARKDLMYIRAITMALADFGRQITSALTSAQVDHALVKGEIFSKALFDNPFDRPYTDVDILLPDSALPAATEAMQSLDLVQLTREYLDRSEARGELKWGHRDAPHLFVELHTDLVHFPWLRSRFSLTYDDYRIANGDGGHPFSGHLVIAVVHAAAGHRFDLLRLVVDILQAVRKLPATDLPHLESAILRLRLQPEFAASLSLVDELFPGAIDYHPICTLREKLRLDSYPKIIGAGTVFHAPGNSEPLSWLTRCAFRLYQGSLARRSA